MLLKLIKFTGDFDLSQTWPRQRGVKTDLQQIFTNIPVYNETQKHNVGTQDWCRVEFTGDGLTDIDQSKSSIQQSMQQPGH